MWLRRAVIHIIAVQTFVFSYGAETGSFTLPQEAASADVTSLDHSPPRYSRKQLRDMMRNAHTPEDHEKLAAYFHARAEEFRAKEEKEQQALKDYLANPGRYPAKYPTRGDAAKQSAGNYGLEARKAAAQAAEQQEIAEKLRGAR